MLDPKMTIALVFAIIFLAWRKRERLCLRVIRWGLILILPRLGGWEYLWLRHYLIGKGGRRSVPAETRGDILLVALRNALDHDLEEGIDRGTQILVGSSTFFHMDYEAKESGASNFMARPVLFRLVGGFSVQAYVNFGVDSGGTDGYVRVYGEDEYDWHPNGPDGQWYGSPVDSAKMTRVLELIAKLARLFGVDTSKWWGRNIPERSAWATPCRSVTVYGPTSKTWAPGPSPQSSRRSGVSTIGTPRLRSRSLRGSGTRIWTIMS
jgi:hypothetical protein